MTINPFAGMTDEEFLRLINQPPTPTGLPTMAQPPMGGIDLGGIANNPPVPQGIPEGGVPTLPSQPTIAPQPPQGKLQAFQQLAQALGPLVLGLTMGPQAGGGMVQGQRQAQEAQRRMMETQAEIEARRQQQELQNQHLELEKQRTDLSLKQLQAQQDQKNAQDVQTLVKDIQKRWIENPKMRPQSSADAVALGLQEARTVLPDAAQRSASQIAELMRLAYKSLPPPEEAIWVGPKGELMTDGQYQAMAQQNPQGTVGFSKFDYSRASFAEKEAKRRQEVTTGPKENEGQIKRDVIAQSTYGKTWAELDPKSQEHVLDLVEGIGKEPPPNLTEDAKMMLAKVYASTGQIPAMGWGGAGARLKAEVIDMAARMFPSLDPASSAAEYSANKNSLAQLTKMKDGVESFERTALKNWDLFEKAAKPIIDSGSPIVNTPLRAMSASGLGSAELAAYRAARQVAINEIAKVTSNPTMAGILSDSARKEVEEFIPQNATIKQIYSVGKILKYDMKNRIDSLYQQIEGIRGRIAAGPTGTTAPSQTNPTAAPAPSAKPSGVRIKDPKTGRTGTYNGTAEEAKKAGYEVI